MHLSQVFSCLSPHRLYAQALSLMAVLGYGVRLYNSPAKGSAKGAFLLKTCLILSLCLQMQKKDRGILARGACPFLS